MATKTTSKDQILEAIDGMTVLELRHRGLRARPVPQPLPRGETAVQLPLWRKSRPSSRQC